MKVLFLDVDGVLNSKAWMIRSPRASFMELDPAAIARVQRIVAQTGAKVVLSSTWRLMDELVVSLLRAGVPVFSKTPDLARKGGGLLPRSREIAAWLLEHPEVTKYAIVDDDVDAGYGALAPSFVHTDARYGLLDSEVEKIVAILGESYE
jgi:hypothetical protein